MDQTEGVNGTFLASDGRMLAAQAYGHRVLALSLGGDRPSEVAVLAADPTWNQPNDVCQSPAGHVYFSDPDFKTRTRSAVYHLAPDGRVSRVITDMTLPNGLVVSNNGRTLYVADSHEKHWRAFPIRADGSVGSGRVFFDPDVADRSDPDGMTIDEHGRLYFTGRGGVWVVRPDGTRLVFIPVPEFCSNLTFGGPEGKTLYLTCKHKVYSLSMAVRGGRSGGCW
jgi:gluconolactonase